MHDLAVEQIGDGGEPDMRMRPHVEAVAGREHRRPEMIEEHERPDHARLRRRQRAPHREAVAEIGGARHDHRLDRVALEFVAGGGVLAGKETHGAILPLSPLRTAQASVTNFWPFSEPTRPSNTSLTLAQLGSFFMVSSQRLTFG